MAQITRIYSPVYSGDDAHVYADSSNFYSATGYLLMGRDDATTENSFIGFRNVDIPKGKIVVGAYIQFYDNGTKTSTYDLDCNIKGLKNFIFPTTKTELIDALRTTAVVRWYSADTNQSKAAAKNTPDISQIVNELINLPGYTDTLIFAFDTTSSSPYGNYGFDSTDQKMYGTGVNNTTPKLYITYEDSIPTPSLGVIPLGWSDGVLDIDFIPIHQRFWHNNQIPSYDVEFTTDGINYSTMPHVLSPQYIFNTITPTYRNNMNNNVEILDGGKRLSAGNIGTAWKTGVVTEQFIIPTESGYIECDLPSATVYNSGISLGYGCNATPTATSTNVSYDLTSMKFGVALRTEYIQIYENGVAGPIYSGIPTSAKVRLAVENRIVKVYVNGVLKYTYATQAYEPLVGMFHFNSVLPVIKNISMNVPVVNNIRKLTHDFTNGARTQNAQLRTRALVNGVYSAWSYSNVFKIGAQTQTGIYSLIGNSTIENIPVYDPNIGMDGRNMVRTFLSDGKVACFDVQELTGDELIRITCNTKIKGIKR
jgi:hypothetical protein